MVSGQQAKRPGEQGKREAILQAAWRLIRQYGYAKATVSDIAREAEVGKGTAYLYFRSKRDIMLALVDRTNERLTQDLEQIAAGREPPRERLRACLLHRVLRIYDLVHRYPHGEEVISSLKPDIVQRIDRHVRAQGEILARIVREGGFAVTDPEAAGQLLAGLFELLTPPYYRFRTRKSLEEFAAQVADLVLRGLTGTARQEESDGSIPQVTRR
ncbi:MAG: TetR/AcrR family transcriptional regulator [Planctomycetota bacterium]|jgi:AcrR family transcriptional regulator